MVRRCKLESRDYRQEVIRRPKEMLHSLKHRLKEVLVHDAGQLVSGVSNLGHHRSHGGSELFLCTLGRP